MDLLEGNPSVIPGGSVGVSGPGSVRILLVGLLTYFLACTATFFFLVEFWISNKEELKKWWKRMMGERDEMEDGEQVGGLEIVPGPRPVGRFLGNCFQCLPVHRTLHNLKSFCEQYGNIIKIYGNFETVLILNSPDAIQQMLKATNYAHVVKAPIVYDLMKPFITNGVLVSKGKFWQNERKILLRSMSFQSLRAYITMLNVHCERFVTCLEKIFEDGQPHMINEEINASFLEVICEVITGFDINGTKEGFDYHHNFQQWKETIAHRLMHPWLVPNAIWKLTPMAWRTDKAIQGLVEFARRRITEHRQKLMESHAQAKTNNNDEETAKNDSKLFRSVLDELVDAGVSDDQIVDEVNTMLFGGHETGASTIHFFCFCMALYPEIQEQCRREADEVFEDPMHTCDGRLSYDAVGSLKYIERCILETLRLYPPVWAFLRQLQAPLRIHIKGKPVDIPVGTNVTISPYILHRTAEFYPEPEKFDPDRFLPEEAARRHAYSYVPFSAGPRNCLGLKFGMIEMKIVAAYLVRHFSIQTTDKLEDVALLPNLTLTPERDYNFIFKKRSLAS